MPVSKESFNSYCADVMGIELDFSSSQCNNGLPSYFTKHKKWKLYSPYDDLNQASQVADKLMSDKGLHITLIDEESIKKQIRDFIISTMGDSE